MYKKDNRKNRDRIPVGSNGTHRSKLHLLEFIYDLKVLGPDRKSCLFDQTKAVSGLSLAFVRLNRMPEALQG